MIFFGHKFIDSENFYHILDIDAIKNTPPSSTIYVEFSEDNLDIIKHTIQNSIKTAVEVNSVTELIYSNALNASFLIVPKELAKTAQNLAENYLFDAKILVHVEDEEEIEELALLGIDGVIYPNAIVKINS